MRKNKELSFGHSENKQIKKLLIYLSVILLLLIGLVYQNISIYVHASEYGRLGSLVDINGHAMHLYTSGSSKLPLVFASNIGTSSPYAEMYPLTSQLPPDTSVAIYDKPGYGWSDLTKAPRDIDTITSEIHTVLHQTDNPRPFILVAHSMGSLEVLRYAQLYPDDVAGIVLIDGASPEFCSKFNNIMIVESFLTNVMRNMGVLRLFKSSESFQNDLNPGHILPKKVKAVNEGLTLEKTWNRNMIEEKLKLQDNAQKIIDSGSIGSIPLRIITSKANPYGSWQETQKDLLKFSSNSSQTFMNGSVDNIDKQDISTILSVINALKQTLQQPDEE